jgi:hypothetical protein
MVVLRVALVTVGIAAQVLGLVTAYALSNHLFAIPAGIAFLVLPALLVGGALWLGPRAAETQGRQGEAAVLGFALALLTGATGWMMLSVISPAERGIAARNPPPSAPR